MRYAVQTHTICDGWINNWSDECGVPATFITEHEAFAELFAFLAEMRAAYLRGDVMDTPSIGDFRIVTVMEAKNAEY